MTLYLCAGGAKFFSAAAAVVMVSWCCECRDNFFFHSPF